MENANSTLALNLSNQANTSRSKRSELTQFNFFVMLGIQHLEDSIQTEAVPVSISINKAGELTLNGLDKELADDRNISVFSDKKVTKSSDYFEI